MAAIRRGRSQRSDVLIVLSIVSWLVSCRVSRPTFAGLAPRRPLSRLRPHPCASATRLGASSDDIAAWSARELKAFLDKNGVGHRDCFEKQELIDRARSVQERAPEAAGTASPAPAGGVHGRGDFSDAQLSAMTARQLKALLLEAGAGVGGCIFKEDYLERARQVLLPGGAVPEGGGKKKSYE